METHGLFRADPAETEASWLQRRKPPASQQKLMQGARAQPCSLRGWGKQGTLARRGRASMYLNGGNRKKISEGSGADQQNC